MLRGAAHRGHDQGIFENLVVLEAQLRLDLVECDREPSRRLDAFESQRFSHLRVMLLSAVRPWLVVILLESR